MAGQPERGLSSMRNASQVGYDDTGIHAIIGTFLTDQGLFKEAYVELEKMSLYPENMGVTNNNWGYYYYRTQNYENAIASFRKAIEFDSEKYVYYKNLAHALYKAGRKNEAALFFRKSLDIHQDQPEIEAFMRDNNLKYIPLK